MCSVQNSGLPATTGRQMALTSSMPWSLTPQEMSMSLDSVPAQAVIMTMPQLRYNNSGEEQWVVRYNGPGNDDDIANAMAIDASGNIYVTGRSLGNTGHDYATVKYNASGQEQWVARYNGPTNGHDVANAIAVGNSGNVYVTGSSQVGGIGNNDYVTIKVRLIRHPTVGSAVQRPGKY